MGRRIEKAPCTVSWTASTLAPTSCDNDERSDGKPFDPWPSQEIGRPIFVRSHLNSHKNFSRRKKKKKGQRHLNGTRDDRLEIDVEWLRLPTEHERANYKGRGCDLHVTCQLPTTSRPCVFPTWPYANDDARQKRKKEKHGWQEITTTDVYMYI